VTIVSELRPLLEATMKASQSEWVFVLADSTPYTPDVWFHLVDHLRRALKWAGVVEGYQFICPWKGCGFEKLWPAAEEARCPRCNMRLWVSPIPRKLRFYDLRHTHATLLRKAGVGPGRRPAQPRPLLARDHGRRVRPRRPGGLPVAGSHRVAPIGPRGTVNGDPAVRDAGSGTLLSVAEVALRLGVCRATVYRICRAGRLAHIRVSNSIRVPKTGLANYLEHGG
jgi:excisionase family DNA binding protein